MALPLSRNRTYGPESQVASADLNDMQDQIVALRYHGDRSRIISAYSYFPQTAGWIKPTSTNAEWGSSGTSEHLMIPFDATFGMRLRRVEVNVKWNDAGTPPTFRLRKQTRAGSHVNVGAAFTPSVANSLNQWAVSELFDHRYEAECAYYIYAFTGIADDQGIWQTRLTEDRPLPP